MEKQSSPFPRLHTKYIALDSLGPSKDNPRKHSRRQIELLAKSISTFGQVMPIVHDSTGTIIIGHARYEALRLLKCDEALATEVAYLSPEQILALRIADNRLSERSEWDEGLLGEQIKILSDADLTFSLEVTAFETAELDILIEGVSASSPGKHDAADELPQQLETAVTRGGDLWQLGKHKVLCGSALSKNDYEHLLGKTRAHVVCADPPYNCPIQGHVSGNGKTHHREFAMASGEMTTAEFTKFLTTSLSLTASFSKLGSMHFICMDWRNVGELLAAGASSYSELKNICVWVKDNPGMGSLYRSQHEFVFVFKNGSEPHRNNIQLGKFGRSRSNVWNYPGANSFARAGTEADLLSLHPTVKPVALVADAILDCSARGEIVLDPFLGSGTTLIAAERTGRIAYGLELDPLYVDLIVRRWQRFTGKRAVLDGSDKGFDEIAEERSHE
jgi:hypothetical protein